ncbi:hypothetical protein L1049_011786 [Liquidambar formosana]|uniref:Uncharacterized protein n=1 Tax=Liquidambar formosana TaxID=63359 RepID=A0AAP0WXA0_LIQFO
MMNQGGNTDTIAPLDPNLLEKRQVVDTSQGYTSSYLSSATGSEGSSWTMHRADNSTTENGTFSNSSYHVVQHSEPHTRNVQDGLNVASHAGTSSSLGAAGAPQEYNGYTSYPSTTDPYGYGNTGYQGYYHGYQQQSNHSYSQPVGAYQNTGAPYQPLSSFQNTGSYAGPASYSSTYYNPGDYQTSGGYPSSGYSNQTNLWNEGNYANYTSHQYPNYAPDSNGAYSSSTAAATPLQYQQHYKQWADYYSQTEVSCAPGTENMSVTSASNMGCPIPGVTGGYPTSNSQPPPSFTPSWKPESSSSELPSLQPAAVNSDAHDNYWKHGAPGFQNHHVSPLQDFQKPLDSNPSYNSFQDQQKTAYPQGPNLQYPPAHQVPQSYQSPLQTVPSLDTRGVGKLQIPTNPRIASNLALSLPKTNKDSSTIAAAVKPAYIGVSLPKPNDKMLSHDAADSILKPGMFPMSLSGYVERALARCKDEAQRAACQALMKEMITNATADGTLYTRDWDIEPLFPLPNTDVVNNDLPSSTTVSSLPKHKRSPSRRSKSRWEPVPEEKSIDKPTSVNHETIKFSGWLHINERDKKFQSGKFETKEDGFGNIKFPSEQKSANKNAQRPVKRQRFSDGFSAADNGDASSDSDKEQSLTAYYSGAIALANSPEERKRRESRSKRFERGHGHRAETNHFRPKTVGAANLYTKRASALVLSKNFEDGGSRAVEDIDWDALTC